MSDHGGACTDAHWTHAHARICARHTHNTHTHTHARSRARGAQVWDGFDGDCVAQLHCHLEPVMSLAVDAGRLASGDSAGWIFLWDFQRSGPGPGAGGGGGDDDGSDGGAAADRGGPGFGGAGGLSDSDGDYDLDPDDVAAVAAAAVCEY